MYVGPWQEYKLMRVIKDVKAENEKLRSILTHSGTSTPRGSELSSVAPSDHSRTTAAAAIRRRYPIGGAAPSSASLGRGSHPQKPVPLDRRALEEVSSERSTQSAPSVLQGGDMEVLQSLYGSHPLLQELVRGAPLTTSEREAQSGQPGLKRKPGPLTRLELDERAQRRASLHMLYSGGVDARDGATPDADHPPTRGKPASLAARRPPSASRAPNSGAAAVGKISSAQVSGPSMVNRNVVRDLASFYDQHINAAKQQQPVHQAQPAVQTSLGVIPDWGISVPWEPVVGLPPTLDSQLAPPSYSHHAGSPIHAREVNANSVPLRASPALPAPIPGRPPVGSGEAQHRYMQRRPYDVGPPIPSAPVFPAMLAHSQLAGATPDIPSHTVTSLLSSSASSTAAALGTTGPLSSNSVDDFVIGKNEDRLHQRAEEVLRNSVEKRHTGRSLPAYLPPPPPSLPVDFLLMNGSASPKKPHSPNAVKGTAARPLSMGTDVSLDDDEDVGALLHWAASLDTRDAWGRAPF